MNLNYLFGDFILDKISIKWILINTYFENKEMRNKEEREGKEKIMVKYWVQS